MMKLQVIGNLGADATVQNHNGNQFVSFRVAHTEQWTNKQTGEVNKATTWVSCIMNGNGGGLTQYLKKGTKVYVDGNVSFNVYSSPATHQMECGVNLNVRTLELCGGKMETPTTEQKQQNNDIEPF